MRVLTIRNVNQALPAALNMLNSFGVQRDSRNGPVLFGGAVTTVYKYPVERVLFWPERDANPFFHLYESLWMLMGRNDVAPLCRYVKNSTNYSDDGKILHGAYGYRWRHRQHGTHDVDQLEIIAQRLRDNPQDRRCVLQMWSEDTDLMTDETSKMLDLGKDFPCNTMATFQRGVYGELNLIVFCRSNDIIWGAYGANAVQFGALLEYMALWIGCPIGTYSQVSVNWHGYLSTLKPVDDLKDMYHPENLDRYTYPSGNALHAHAIPMAGDGEFERVDELISILVEDADAGFPSGDGPDIDVERWSHMVYHVLKSHHIYKSHQGIERYKLALEELAIADDHADWVVAAREWYERRLAVELNKHENQQ